MLTTETLRIIDKAEKIGKEKVLELITDPDQKAAAKVILTPWLWNLYQLMESNPRIKQSLIEISMKYDEEIAEVGSESVEVAPEASEEAIVTEESAE